MILDLKPDALIAMQEVKAGEWHRTPFAASQSGFLERVEGNHRCNFELWHEEDKARRDDMGFEYVYRAKRSIDSWNQLRNNYIERMDQWIVERIAPFPEGTPMNSETPGMIIDRLSILGLKEYHMKEEAERLDASQEHRTLCNQKLEVIRRQRGELSYALEDLMRGIAAGTRGFRVYFQFKMYNDPSLNPQLYRTDNRS